MGLENSLWRAIAVFRVGALAYAAYLVADGGPEFARPGLAWVVVAAMAAWTGIATAAYGSRRWRGWPLLLTDLAVTIAVLSASGLALDERALRAGAATLPMAWVAAPVLAFAVALGRRYAFAAAGALYLADGRLRGFTNDVAVNGLVLLLLAGLVIGYLHTLAAAAERRLQRATELEAAQRERERLARSIHDSVLQALALIQRRGAELGGPAAELGRLAGEQGAVLRTLVGVGTVPAQSAGEVDLRSSLARFSSPLVSVAMPATAVLLPSRVAVEVQAAIAAALANVAAHAGTGGRAVVLIEDEAEVVTVTVRDEGVGMVATRLAEAEADGRLGVAQSIRGRIRDVAGSVSITSSPGAGTEVELRVPRPASLAPAARGASAVDKAVRGAGWVGR